MSQRKLRLATFHVQPLLMWDDGETLTPALQQDGKPLVGALAVGVKGLAELAEAWPETLAEISAAVQPAPHEGDWDAADLREAGLPIPDVHIPAEQ